MSTPRFDQSQRDWHRAATRRSPQGRSAIAAARKALQAANPVFNYSKAAGIAMLNPKADMVGALKLIEI